MDMIWIYHTTGSRLRVSTPSFEVKNTFIEVSSDSDVSDVEQEFKGLLVHLQLAVDMWIGQLCLQLCLSVVALELLGLGKVFLFFVMSEAMLLKIWGVTDHVGNMSLLPRYFLLTRYSHTLVHIIANLLTQFATFEHTVPMPWTSFLQPLHAFSDRRLGRLAKWGLRRSRSVPLF